MKLTIYNSQKYITTIEIGNEFFYSQHKHLLNTLDFLGKDRYNQDIHFLMEYEDCTCYMDKNKKMYSGNIPQDKVLKLISKQYHYYAQFKDKAIVTISKYDDKYKFTQYDLITHQVTTSLYTLEQLNIPLPTPCTLTYHF